MGLIEANFDFHINKKQAVLRRGETALIKYWSWRKFRMLTKAVTIEHDYTVRVTFL